MTDPFEKRHAPGDLNDYLVARFLGFAFLLVGVLWMGLSGLCSLFMLQGVATGGVDLSGLGIILLIGGPSILIGFGIFAAGRAMVWPYRNLYVPPPRHDKPPPPP